MVDRPLGEAGRQHELAVGHGDEAVAQRMESELRPASLADARIEMLNFLKMAGPADLGRKHPARRFCGESARSAKRRSRMAASWRVESTIAVRSNTGGDGAQVLQRLQEATACLGAGGNGRGGDGGI